MSISGESTVGNHRRLCGRAARKIRSIWRVPVRNPRYVRRIVDRACLLQMAMGLLAITNAPTEVPRSYIYLGVKTPHHGPFA